MKVGVLALQGAFFEHIQMLKQMGISTVEVRLPQDLDNLNGLIIPGGESTTIGKLAGIYGLIDSIKQFAVTKPLWGTCAGMIFMSKTKAIGQPLLNLMDIEVKRNAFGRQKDSFSENLFVGALDQGDTRPFPGIFIRSPRIESINADAIELARLADGTSVAAQQDNLLVTAFHPELTSDDRFHQYFLSLIE